VIHRSSATDPIWEALRNPKCTACSLHKGVTTVCCLASGAYPSLGLVVGEGPGHREDESEENFSGKSGKFLRQTLLKVGIDPRTLTFANVVCCRPPGNRTPTRSEAKTCTALYLDKQIEMIKPKAILLLGNVAVSWALNHKKCAVTKLEGSTFKLHRPDVSVNQTELFIEEPDPIVCVPSRHPSSVLRAENERDYAFILQKFTENLLLFKRELSPEKKEFPFSRDLTSWLDKPSEAVYTDIETNGLNPFLPQSKIWSTGFAQLPGKVSCTRVDEDRQLAHIQGILKTHPIIAHRSTFEGTWYRRHYGVTPRIYHDTKVGAYLQNENAPNGLKTLAISKLGVEPWSEEQNWQDPNFETLLPYEARDISYGLRLYRESDLPFLKKNPKIARLMRYILLPAIEVLIEIICNGFHINEKEARKKLEHCQAEKARINAQINAIAGKEINPGSPKQLSRLFYKQLRLTCPVKTRKGAESTSEAALIRLRGQHPITNLVWEWRGWQKQESTYLRPWLEQGPVLHANYDPTGTDTGRLSSSMVKNTRGEKGKGAVIHQCPRDPFIRNVISPRGYLPSPYHDLAPLRKKLGVIDWLDAEEAKSARESHPEDWCILEADWSQIELRLIAHVACEPTMIQIFKEDGDIHLVTAMDISGKPANQIDKETRKRAKSVGFGFCYGMMAKKFASYALEKFDLKVTDDEAREYRKKYFRRYAALLPWHRRVEALVRANGYIDSIFGRRRRVPEAREATLNECPTCGGRGEESCFECGGRGVIEAGGSHDEWVQREAIRAAINAPIQGGASDLLLFLLALIASYSLKWEFKIDRKRSFPIGTAHDSGLFECHRSYARELRDGLMWTASHLPLKKFFDIEMRVPLKVDCEIYEDFWKGKILSCG
jgi:uracil-DNA glycosylase family 4